MNGDRITGRGVHPYSLRNTVTNPLATMIPLSREQAMVYRPGERRPPSGDMTGHAPTWECISMVLAALSTAQVRVNLQRDFTLLALNTGSSSTVVGGFRAQLYDIKRKVRFADRGIQFALMGGTGQPVFPSAPFFLREPLNFPDPDSQLLVMVQNLESAQNTIQIVLYGNALPFNEPRPEAQEFPGGIVSTATGVQKQKASNP